MLRVSYPTNRPSLPGALCHETPDVKKRTNQHNRNYHNNEPVLAPEPHTQYIRRWFFFFSLKCSKKDILKYTLPKAWVEIPKCVSQTADNISLHGHATCTLVYYTFIEARAAASVWCIVLVDFSGSWQQFKKLVLKRWQTAYLLSYRTLVEYQSVFFKAGQLEKALFWCVSATLWH